MMNIQTNSDDITTKNIPDTIQKESKFIKRTIRSNALACNNIMLEDFDKEKAEQISRDGLMALKANDGLQAMLASQLISIHQLQQTAMTMANGLQHGETSQYFVNTAIKLSNTFVSQATLLAKLQNGSGQNITVEQVNVSDGGQAIIGSVNASDRQ